MRARCVGVAICLLVGVVRAPAAPLLWAPDQREALLVKKAPGMRFLGHELAAGDLDGDGRDDLALVADEQLVVVMGSGGPRRVVDLASQQASTTLVPRLPGDGVSLVGMADVDGDGHDDLAVASQSWAPVQGGEIWIFLHRPAWPATIGADDADAVIASSRVMGNPILGDLDDDGMADLLFSREGADGRNEFGVVLGRPTWPRTRDLDTAPPEIVVVSPTTTDCCEPLLLADMNGDGLTDLLVQRYENKPQLVVLGRSPWPALVDLAVTPPDASLFIPPKARGFLADLTGDGAADLLFQQHAQDETALAAYSVVPALDAVPEIRIVMDEPGASSVRVLAASDLDGDAVADLVVAFPGAGPRGRQPGSGTIVAVKGPFASGTTHLSQLPQLWCASGHQPRAGMIEGVVLDFDGDGRLDLAASTEIDCASVDYDDRGEIRVWTRADMREPLAASDLHVDPVAGDDAADGLAWSSALRTLEAALLRIDGRAGRGRILAARGRYEGRLVIGRGTTLEGGYDPTGGSRALAPSGSLVTPAFAHPSGTLLTVHAGAGDEKVRIEGLEIGEAHEYYRTPGLLQESGDLELAHVVFSNLRMTAGTQQCWPDSCYVQGPWDEGVAATLHGRSTRLENILIHDCELVLPHCDCGGLAPLSTAFWSDAGELFARHVTSSQLEQAIVAAGLARVESSIVRGLELPAEAVLEGVLEADTLLANGGSRVVGEPIFAGPGVFRLAATATGQAVDSPGLDLGSLDAGDDCDASGCMSALTTRLDGMPDEGRVDLGFHWDARPNRPPAFAGLTLAQPDGDCRIEISWSPAVDPEGDPLAYFVFAGDDPAGLELGEPAAILDAPATSWSEDVAHGVTHHYLVRAQDEEGWRETNLVTRSATALDSSPPDATLDVQVRSACSVRLLAPRVQDGCAPLAWQEYHRSDVAGFVPGPATRISSTLGAFADSVPANGIWHYRRVLADAAGHVATSDQVSVRVTTCLGAVPPPLPPRLLALRREGGAIVLPYLAEPGTLAVRLYRGALASLLAGAPDHVVSSGADGVEGTPDDVGSCSSAASPAIDAGAAGASGDLYWVASAMNDAGEGPLGFDSLGAETARGVASCP